MSQRLGNPFHQFVDSAGNPYSGGSLTFHQTESSTPLDTYSDPDLDISHVNTNPVVLNSAGRPSVAIFLKNQDYKVTLKDSDGNTIWVADPVRSSDFESFSILKVGSGSPSGVVAGTAGSSGVIPTSYWDFTNSILYFCSVTGNAATAEWTAVNAAAATPTVTPPQGYLTPTPGTTIITSGATASTQIGYEPFIGNLVPLYNGSRHVPTEFSALTLDLVSAHAANQLYDVFVFSNVGVVTLVTGPAWSTPTAGSGARGTGAGTTQLSRLNGFWVNTVSMTGRNGSTTYSIGANLATYVGSIFMDGSNGQITCHLAWGQSRKWGVWNAYNRQPIFLKAGDAMASWPYNTATIRASNGASANSLTVFQGLAEEHYDLEFVQRAGYVSTPSVHMTNGIGWNSTTVMSGLTGSTGATDDNGFFQLMARHLQVPAIGINVVTALENAPDPAGTSATWYGTEADMLLSALWRG